MNLPTMFTFARIASAPILVVFYLLPFPGNHWICASIFVLASLTDWLDGFIARRYHLETKLGTFLDPVADKVLVGIALILLVGAPHLHFITVPAAIIVSREIIISALREWMAEIGKRTSVAVSLLGKVKTVAQMTAISILLAYKPTMQYPLNVLGTLLLYLAALLTLWSMFIYLKAAWPTFRDEPPEERTLTE